MASEFVGIVNTPMAIYKGIRTYICIIVTLKRLKWSKTVAPNPVSFFFINGFILLKKIITWEKDNKQEICFFDLGYE